MAASLDQFASQLVASGLMSADDVQAVIGGVRDDQRPTDGEQLARLLVRQKKLTRFQAEQIYAGKGKSLSMGNYVILDKLGQGGMGMVLKAEHRRMKRLVALKVLSPAVTKNPESMRRFQREVEAAAKLEHPNIVTAYDADEANGTHFLVMQYVEGTDLSVLVRDKGPLPVEKAVPCIVQAARGLAYAHTRGVVHRDIKPANLLLDREGTVKVLDMGLARLSSAGADQDQLTGTGQIMGTVDYMSPEQAIDTKSADGRADIYSLGITLWYLLTGRVAYDGDTAVNKLMSHQRNPIPSLRGACPAASVQLDAVFNKMVAKTPETRYQSMTEVITDLERCLGGGPLSGLPLATTPADDGPVTQFPLGMEGTSADPAAATKTSPPKNIAMALEGEPTVTMQSPQVDTDLHTEQSLVSPTAARTTLQRQPAAPWWQRRNKWIASGAGLLILLCAGIIFNIATSPDRASRVASAPGHTAQTEQVEGLTPPSSPKIDAGWHGWPADAPAPAIAPFNAAQAKKHQEAWAAYLKVPVEYTNSLGMKFMLIPPGEFTMGSTEAEIEAALKFVGEDKHWQECVKLEAPQHRVILTQPIYLSEYEVTQAEYEKVMGTNPSHFAPLGLGKEAVAGMETTDDHPVEMVSWNDAAEFCAKLSQQEKFQPFYVRAGGTIMPLDGTGYRLPSEAEWEYSCRAGTVTKYWVGDKNEDLVRAGWVDGSSGNRTHAAGGLKANPFGLADIHGNVWEWVQDGWDVIYYSQFREKPAINPNSPFSANPLRVLRGGRWNNSASNCRSSFRHAVSSTTRLNSIGFRISLVVDAVESVYAERGATLGKSSAIRRGLEFDGIDDYVEIPSLKLDWTAPVTWEARLDCDNLELGKRYVVLSDRGATVSALFWDRNWALARYQPPGWNQWGDLSVVRAGKIHLACVWDGRQPKLYIDGKALAAQFSQGDGPTYESEGGTVIGAMWSPVNRAWAPYFFRGRIEAVRVSKSVRYKADFAPAGPEDRISADVDTLALYHFDEGVGGVLKDSSGHGHDGKIVGAKWVKLDAKPPLPGAPVSDGLSFDGGGFVELPRLGVLSQPQFSVEAIVTPSRLLPMDGVGSILHSDVNMSLGMRDRGAWLYLLSIKMGNMMPTIGQVELNHRVHLAAIRDGNTVNLFVDGKSTGSYTPPGEPLEGLQPQAMPRLGEGFPGVIHELRVSKTVRYSQDFQPPATLASDINTEAVYHFDEGRGNKLTDLSPHQRHGRIVGATWVPKGAAVESVTNLLTPQLYDFYLKLWPQVFSRDPAGLLVDHTAPTATYPVLGPAAWNREESTLRLRAREFGPSEPESQFWIGFATGNEKGRVYASLLGQAGSRTWILATLDDWQDFSTLKRLAEAPASEAPNGVRNIEFRFANGTAELLEGGKSVVKATGIQAQPVKPNLGISKAKWLIESWTSQSPPVAGITPPMAKAPFETKQALAHQQAWATHLGVPVEYTNSIGMKFVLIPPGEFTMGSTPAELDDALKAAGENKIWQDIANSEAPQHQVRLTQPIYIGVHEVTQGQYAQVMGLTPSHFAVTGTGSEAVAGKETLAHPVEMVSWNDAAEFCAKLSSAEKHTPFYIRTGETVAPLNGTGYRLPLEAEWEFACRAGTTSRYWIGDKDEDLFQAGWFKLNAGDRTHMVGEMAPNPFGLHDVHGNVWEWVQDWWVPAYYEQFRSSSAIDPNGPSAAGSGSERVIRGGRWGYPSLDCRSSRRYAVSNVYRGDNIGFRVALVVDAVKVSITDGNTPQQDFALQFDGQSSYVQLPNLQWNLGATRTVEALVTPAEVSARGGIFAWGEGKNSLYFQQDTGPNGTSSHWAAAGETPKVKSLSTSPPNSIVPGKPVHLAVVQNGEQIQLFVDGRRQTEQTTLSPSAGDAKLTAFIGGYPLNAPEWRQFFRGRIDEMRISNSARYSQDYVPIPRLQPDPNTLALYHFDEGQGEVLKDSSGHGQDGKIVGAKWVPKGAVVPWQSLFNGRDLNGWKSLWSASWTSTDGVLTGAAPAPTDRDVLITDRDFSDFEMELEFKTSTGCDGGLLLRESDPAVRKTSPRMLEIQLGNDQNTLLRTGTIISSNPRFAPVNLPPAGFANDQWHQLKVHAQRRHLRVTIDGMPIAEAEAFAEGHQSGAIGLQLWSGTISFRNIRVRELKP